MPFRPLAPPDDVVQNATTHLQRIAAAPGLLSVTREGGEEDLFLVAPHRVYALGLAGLLEEGVSAAEPVGWRFLVMSDERVIASVDVSEKSEVPSVNRGPYVASTARAIDELERLPQVAQYDFELRLLTIPGLYVIASWMAGTTHLFAPQPPAPSFLDTGRIYGEEELLEALRGPAREVLAHSEDGSGG
jgi:hypothetical protein